MCCAFAITFTKGVFVLFADFNIYFCLIIIIFIYYFIILYLIYRGTR